MPDVLDKAALMSRIGGDFEFLADMLTVYDEDRRTLTSQMRDALSRQDGVALADAAHSLRGLAQNLSADAVSEAARMLEEMAQKGEFDAAEEALLFLETEATRLRRVADYHARYGLDLLQRELERRGEEPPELAETRLELNKTAEAQQALAPLISGDEVERSRYNPRNGAR